jgi:sodium/bile acid cotransporter 7
VKLEGDFSRLFTLDKAIMVVVVLSVHLTALFIGYGSSLALGHAPSDAKAVGIAGSQKTLMVGLHVAIQYFGGLAMLPMIVYHVGQLLVDTIVADWMRQRDIKLPVNAERKDASALADKK